MFLSKTTEYTLFSSAHGMFSSVYHTLGHKTGLNKFKRLEIVSTIFSYHNGKKLQINWRKKNGKNTHMETEQHATIKKFNKAIKQEIREKSETDENKNTSFPKSGHSNSLQLCRST